MVVDEFEHYFRICMPRTLEKSESRAFLLLVSKFTEVEPTDDDVVMVYHEDSEDNPDNPHCYDVRLADDISGDEGDQILLALEELFSEDDFDCESSMDTVSESYYLNQALLEQLKQKLV
jgi:hypothetical protein